MAKSNTPNSEVQPAAKKDAVQETKASTNELKAPQGFRLKNWTFPSKINAGKFGVIDLETLTPRRAEILVQMKFPYLEKES